MSFNCWIASSIVFSLSLTCFGQVSPGPTEQTSAFQSWTTSSSQADEIVGSKVYRPFVGSGDGMVIVEPAGRVLVFQQLDTPIEGKQWRILAATPTGGIKFAAGQFEGHVTVTADYANGANHGFRVNVQSWQSEKEDLHMYFATDSSDDARLNNVANHLQVIGVQTTLLTREQLNAVLKPIINGGIDQVGNAWGLVLEETDMSNLVVPMSDTRCNNCDGGGYGSTSCTISDHEWSKSVVCPSTSGTHACCGGSGSSIFAICCPD